VLQGFKLGATIEEMQADRARRALQQQQLQEQIETRNLQQRKLQEEMDKQRRLQEAVARFGEKPASQRTEDDYTPLLSVLPAESITALRNLDKDRTDAQKQNDASFYSQVAAAIRSNRPDIALQLATDREEAETDPARKQQFKVYRETIDKAPDAAFDTTVTMMYGLGGNYAQAAKGIFETRSTDGQTVSSDADKIRFGLVDSQGKPLQGTWFKPSKGEPKRISDKPEGAGQTVFTDEAKIRLGIVGDNGKPLTGTYYVDPKGEPKRVDKDAKQFVTLTAEQLAQRLNVPVNQVEPGIYKFNLGTEEASKIGGAGVTVNVGDKEGQKQVVQIATDELRPQMRIAANTLADVARYKESLKQAITGPFAEERILISRVLGFNPKQLSATREVVQGLAKFVLNARGKLQGQGAISNMEQEALAKAESGEINLSRVEIQALFDAAERDARLMYNQNNEVFNSFLESFPDIKILGAIRKSIPALPGAPAAPVAPAAPAAPAAVRAAPSAPVRVPEGMSPEAAARWQSMTSVEPGAAGGSKAPAGVPQDVWNVMTPQERALWPK
jgi:hypothetical protein